MITNAGVTNSLRVLWYLRSGSLLRSYSYSTVNGSPTALWAYTSGSTSTATGIKTGYYAPVHHLAGYTAGPPAAWSKVTCYTVQQP